METRAHHVLVGLFTLLTAAGALLFTLWLGKVGDDSEVRRLDIVFTEPVSGLSVGSAVQYSGIRVGEVENLTLNPDDPRQVRARVRIAADAPVKTDTRARLALANITGAANIALSHGSPDSPLLAQNKDDIPVIQAEPSPFTRLRVNSEELMVGLNNLLDSANHLLTPENAAHVSHILANLDTVTSGLAQQQGALNEGVSSLSEAAVRLDTMIARLDRQFARHSEPLLADTAATAASLQRLSARLEQLLARQQPALEAGVQGLAGLEPTLRELRHTLRSLGDVTRQLQQDPAGTLLEREQMEVFQP
ncbi:MlaD family protein [Oceanimonas baumannii]|uniref:Mammalian cell entry protein n=1 Tax=Oceanimonas baumannii TaxID=129578 RepID=A0A235CJ37_9GAMM|nr:MlaD family protein [Oceanimonas baumannii]OYD24552.1 mammalian cell entry protein [Oceanimonas baumannii]TDW59285.1 phospholipid/cholesterol/gamma-HCH transport system substrate-binding protein [Oceanimonas baumannii]